MQDLTQGSIPRHLVRLSAPIAAGMLFQTMYYLVDLFFISRLGDAAIAGAGAAGNVQFIVMALTQVLGVGTMALIAQAVGRRDAHDANLVFNQSLVIAAVGMVVTLAGGYALAPLYLRTLAADAETVAQGRAYLAWFLPALALQFALVSMGAALRGTGVARPTMIVQVATVVLNAVLAPVLVGGWLTGRPFGVAGAGMASTIAIAVGVLVMWRYFAVLEKTVRVERALLAPRLETWGRILRIGLPPGGEFALMFVFMAVVYRLIRGFGPEAQAGFGIGLRMMQAIFLPAMAVAFAAAPIAGQNFGARRPARVRETFRVACIMGSVLMLLLTAFCQWRPDLLVTGFTREPAVVAVGAEYLRVISWNFVATGIIFTASGLFQALGHTLPSLAASATRLVTFVLPAFWLVGRPGFTLRQLWMLSVATVTLQAVLSVLMLRRELARRLAGLDAGVAAPDGALAPPAPVPAMEA